jgi:hypothetical protein
MDAAYIFARSHLFTRCNLSRGNCRKNSYMKCKAQDGSRSGRRENLGFICFSPIKGRGAYGIRTRDLLNAIEALYQLS